MTQHRPQAGALHVAALIHQQRPDVHFVLAGRDVLPTHQALWEPIAASGLQERVHLLGERDDIPRMMAALDVLASVSHLRRLPECVGRGDGLRLPNGEHRLQKWPA
ncbi:MAG: glycosyltransferase [Anaerolineales bacterium]